MHRFLAAGRLGAALVLVICAYGSPGAASPRGHSGKSVASTSAAAPGGLPSMNLCVMRGDCPPATSMACKAIDCPFTGLVGGQLHTCQQCQLVSADPKQPLGTVGPSACKVSPKTQNCKHLVIYSVDVADWSSPALGNPGQFPGLDDTRRHRRR
jgi:hypothetical protein